MFSNLYVLTDCKNSLRKNKLLSLLLLLCTYRVRLTFTPFHSPFLAAWAASFFVWFAPILTSCNGRTELWLVQRGEWRHGVVPLRMHTVQCVYVRMSEFYMRLYVYAQELAFILECFTKGGCLTRWPLVPLQPYCCSHSICLVFFCRFFVFVLTFRCLRQNKLTQTQGTFDK